jgi:hypothetical protein
MSTIVEILEHLEQATGQGSREEKKSTLQRNVSNELLKAVFKAAQDPFTVYHVTKFKMPPAYLGGVDGETTDSVISSFVHTTLPELSSRRVTGNAAKALVVDAFRGMSPLEQKWCQRILLKNMRAGVQTTINEVWPGLIPTFDVALAEKVKAVFVKGKGIVIKSHIGYPIRAEPKLDGHRLIAVKHNAEVKLYTRNGNEVDSLPTIKASLQDHMPDETVFDGESMGRDWNMTSSVMSSSKNSKDDSGMIYNVFDVMSYEDWVTKTNIVRHDNRVIDIRVALDGFADDAPVKPVHSIVISDEKELLEFYQMCLDRGFEGIMLKKLDEPYIFERSHAVEKLKPVTTYEGVVIGHYLGRKGTKNEGKFGGFRIVLPNGVVTRVGGGYDDKDRAMIQLEGPDSFITKVMEIEAQPDPGTTDGLTVDGKARFPVHMRYREAGDVDLKVIDAGERYLSENGPWITLESEDED